MICLRETEKYKFDKQAVGGEEDPNLLAETTQWHEDEKGRRNSGLSAGRARLQAGSSLHVKDHPGRRKQRRQLGHALYCV